MKPVYVKRKGINCPHFKCKCYVQTTVRCTDVSYCNRIWEKINPGICEKCRGCHVCEYHKFEREHARGCCCFNPFCEVKNG